MRKILAVAVKEVRQVRRDALSLLLLLGLPTFFLVLYGFALNFDVRHVALAVQDDDMSAASRELVSTFVNSIYFDRVASPPAGTDLESLLESRAAKAVLVIPRGFASRLEAGRRAPVQLLLDGSDAITATTVLGYAGALTASANLESLRRTVVTLAPSEAVAGIDYRPLVWYNPRLESTQFLVPGLIGTLLMLTAALSTALSVVREKERGTMEQLRLAPVRTWQVIVGKTLPYLAISLIAAVAIVAVARALFGVAVRGSYVDLLVATLVYLIGGLGFGLLISTLASTQAAAFQLTLLTSNLPAIMLSGYIFQIRSMPEALQWITYAVPARYFLVISRGIILKGAPLGPYWRELAALVVFAVVVLGLATLRLAKEEG
ncbi:MAG: ABC transporter permease [Acidobacteriota bacterium]|nr:ABC transporter permease [Acidobacteriota bacterium]MDH3522645.1 ABC transporter permease [Acidobacteriota bacterium]